MARLDEIDKAHVHVFKVLLQVLEDGRLTDSQGRLVDFKNTVVIMTSNVGSQWIGELGPSDRAEMRRRVDETLRAHFQPEFLNRVDEVLIFDALGQWQIGRIVDIQLDRVARRLAGRKLMLEVTPEARAYLAREGYDPAYGARPLKRTIQRLQPVQSPDSEARPWRSNRSTSRRMTSTPARLTPRSTVSRRMRRRRRSSASE
jgi:ATP-dependent Clp protease ATP-binding subunit ClpB